MVCHAESDTVLQNVPVPTQSNGDDCGIHMLANAQQVLHDEGGADPPCPPAELRRVMREKLDALLKAREAARPVPGVCFES